MGKSQIGLFGLAVMGENLALNVESKGFRISVFNRTTEKTEKFAAGPAAGKNIHACYTMEEFIESLEVPRRVMFMVKAGDPVDQVISQVKPHLEKGDILIDGGNSFFMDTKRRGEELASEGLLFIGTGVSGGEEGALKGPCIMPGGPREAYDAIEPILTKVAAQVPDGPCCAYIGAGCAGHYVKMVHNGIEYGDMQLIAEAYDFMRTAMGMTAGEMHKVFAEWNQGDLGSYLMEITTDILGKKDDLTDGFLVDYILDKAGQKGTGKWTSQSAFDLGVPTPTINSAVTSRVLSAFKDERVKAAKSFRGRKRQFRGDAQKTLDCVRDALLASKIMSYAQGMALLREASKEYKFKLDFAEIARIWKGGCIIRAKLLNEIQAAYTKKPRLANLMLAPDFKKMLRKLQTNWRRAVQNAIKYGVPYLATSASLAYFDGYRKADLPANLTQAQRDYFGAHTYERTDREGTFHTQWMAD